jgi:hypothetical protein
MPELPVRFYPPDLAATEGLDAAALVALVRAFVRERHPAREPDPHEGLAREEVIINAIKPSRGTDRRVEFVYWINRYPQSRYDKSQQCDGHVRVTRDGTAVRDGRLDELEFCTLG